MVEMDRSPLYENKDMRITLLTDGNGNVVSGEDHELVLINSNERYAIQRGLLRQFARTPRGELEVLLERTNFGIGTILLKSGLTYDSVGVAISQAYMEKEERFEEYRRLVRAENDDFSE